MKGSYNFEIRMEIIVKCIITRAVITSVSVSGSYRTILRNIRYQVLGIFKVPDIRYCITDSALAGMVKYFHTNML